MDPGPPHRSSGEGPNASATDGAASGNGSSGSRGGGWLLLQGVCVCARELHVCAYMCVHTCVCMHLCVCMCL